MNSTHETPGHSNVLVRVSLALMICVFSTSSALSTPLCTQAQLGQATSYSVPMSPDSVAVADFNGDNRPDLAVTGRRGYPAPGGVLIMLNDGTGHFETVGFYPAGAYVPELLTGDFNNDGIVDIVASNFFENTVSVLLGNGSGAFGPAIDSPSSGRGPESLGAGDVNHDGKLDLVVSNNPYSGAGHNISVLLGDGMGHFTWSLSLPGVVFLLTADFNRDGNLDIVGRRNEISLYLGNAFGGFSSQPDIVSNIPDTSLAVGDLNSDNKPDIVAVSGSDAISVLIGNGNGTFMPASVYHIGVVYVGSFADIGDVNGDGLADITLSNHATDGRVHVLQGDGNGAFTLRGSYTTGFRSPGRIATSDLNGDGHSDVITVDYTTKLSVFSSTCQTPRYDFDGDGRSDISVFRPSTGIWYGQLTFSNSLFAQGWGMSGDEIVAADYDGDSRTDLAVYRPSNGVWYILTSSNNTVCYRQLGRDGDTPVPADYDGDGRADVAVYRAGAWYILRSSDYAIDSRSFGTSNDMPVPGIYDGDRKADIAVFRPSTGVWYISHSTNGQLRAQAFGANGDVPVPVDYDGDGYADIAVYRPSTGTWYAYRSFSNTLLTRSWGLSSDIPVAADYDGDGTWDTAVFRPSTGGWYILKSSDGQAMTRLFGTNGDVPVPSQ